MGVHRKGRRRKRESGISIPIIPGESIADQVHEICSDPEKLAQHYEDCIEYFKKQEEERRKKENGSITKTEG